MYRFSIDTVASRDSMDGPAVNILAMMQLENAIDPRSKCMRTPDRELKGPRSVFGAWRANMDLSREEESRLEFSDRMLSPEEQKIALPWEINECRNCLTWRLPYWKRIWAKRVVERIAAEEAAAEQDRRATVSAARLSPMRLSPLPSPLPTPLPSPLLPPMTVPELQPFPLSCRRRIPPRVTHQHSLPSHLEQYWACSCKTGLPDECRHCCPHHVNAAVSCNMI